MFLSQKQKHLTACHRINRLHLILFISISKHILPLFLIWYTDRILYSQYTRVSGFLLAAKLA